MKKIKVVLSKRRNKLNLISLIIRLIEKTHFSHAAIVFENHTGRQLIYEASGLSVKFKTLKMFLKENEILAKYELEIEDDVAQNIIDICLDHLGRPYSIKSLFGLLLVRLGITKTNKFADGNDSFVCSELVAYLLAEVSEDNSFRDNFDNVGLRELSQILMDLALTGEKWPSSGS